MKGIPHWAYAGARVKCTKDFPPRALDFKEKKPAKGGEYTIREVLTDNVGHVGIRLVEIVNVPHAYMYDGKVTVIELAFDVRRFIPIITRTIEDDVAIFAPLLNAKEGRDLLEDS